MQKPYIYRLAKKESGEEGDIEKKRFKKQTKTFNLKDGS
jgi:hypothetical protein